MAPISVLVVDDSSLMRRLIRDALNTDPGIRVTGEAADGQQAIKAIETSMPDAVTLDIEMPVMSGLEAIRVIHHRWPRLAVIMFSTLTESGGQATLDALDYGAADYVTKPSKVGTIGQSMARVREELAPKIKALAAPGRSRVHLATNTGGLTAGPSQQAPVLPRQSRPTITPDQQLTPGVTGNQPGARSATPQPAPVGPQPVSGPRGTRLPAPLANALASSGGVQVVAIGCSTGGPEALTHVLKGLPASLNVPIVVVQHMPKIFTKLFAQRLDGSTALYVHEASQDMVLQPGHVYIAPGDYHMRVNKQRSGGVAIELDQGPPVNFCRPAVDPMFHSVAQAFGGQTLAVVLTGMGSDSRSGAKSIRNAGGAVIAQDEASSVVWGMPGAVTTAGLAHAVVGLGHIAPLMCSVLAQTSEARRPARPAAAASASLSAASSPAGFDGQGQV